MTGVADRATLVAIKVQAELSIRQRAIDEAAGQPLKDFVDNVSLGVKIDPEDMADLSVPQTEVPAVAHPSNPQPGRTREPDTLSPPAPLRQPPETATPSATQPVTSPPVSSASRDFRDADHSQHIRYAQTLRAVHAMEDQRSIPHGPDSKRIAAALVDRMHAEGFQELARVELRGNGTDIKIVAVQTQHTPWAATKELALEPDQAMARSVEQSSVAWAERALPHLNQAASLAEQSIPPRTQTPFAAHDLRNPQHPEHSLYTGLRGQIAAAYAATGQPRTEDQIVQATAAVALNMRRNGMTHAEAVILAPDPRTGVIGPSSTIIALHGDHNDPLNQRVVTTAQDLQRAPEDSFRELAQATQQHAAEQVLAHQQRQTRAQAGNGMLMV